MQVKKKCQKIVTVMASVSSTHNLIEKDISQPGGLANMRDTLKDPKALPPQLYSEKLGPLGVSSCQENFCYCFVNLKCSRAKRLDCCSCFQCLHPSIKFHRTAFSQCYVEKFYFYMYMCYIT